MTERFSPPPAAERKCATCPNVIRGPHGGICAQCGVTRDRDAWWATVAIAHQEARSSVPMAYRGIGLRPEDHKNAGPAAVSDARALLVAPRATAVFVGASAAGKTRLACAVFHAYFDRWRDEEPWKLEPAQVAQLESLARQAGGARYARAYEIGGCATWDPAWAIWRAAPLLVVDDLGLEPVGFAPSLIDLLIERVDRRRQTLITTSMSEDGFGGRYGEGVLRRVSVPQKWIVCGGKR